MVTVPVYGGEAGAQFADKALWLLISCTPTCDFHGYQDTAQVGGLEVTSLLFVENSVLLA